MLQESREPSVLRIIQADWVAHFSAGFLASGWGIYIAVYYLELFRVRQIGDGILGSDGDSIFIKLAIITTMTGVPLLLWRVRFFQTLFAEGEEIKGRIIQMSRGLGRVRAEFTYSYHGETYKRWNGSFSRGGIRQLQPGEEITVLVDGNTPTRAFIWDLLV